MRCLAILLLCASCTSVQIDPESLASDDPEFVQAAETLEAAVEAANDFLRSDARVTLPAGQLAWRDGELVFTHAGGEVPMRLRRTTWGDLCEATGFEAQERRDGFVVGARGEGDSRIYNSLFRSSLGFWKQPYRIAELILHELTHVYLEEGTIGTWNSVKYYAEAIFLFRYRNHSAERNAYLTTEEFLDWWRITVQEPARAAAEP
ncbi:MAG: hypothetical protein AAF682_00450 [Planctomycetota bacterium]